MRTSHLLAIALFAALLLVAACTRTRQQAAIVEPQPFLKIGTLYRLTTAGGGTDAGIPAPFVKVRENHRAGWVRAECFDMHLRDGKQMLVRRSDSSWINLAHVISATEKPPMDELSPNAS